MDIFGSISAVQGILIACVSVVLIWIALSTLLNKSRRGDVGGSWEVVTASLGPLVLIALGVAGIAIVVVSGLLKSAGIG